MAAFHNIGEWVEKHPELQKVVRAEPFFWLNPGLKSMDDSFYLPLGKKEMEEGRIFMQKYAPYIAQVFPETQPSSGRIVSPVRKIDEFRALRNATSGVSNEGRFFLKCDNELPVAGSIKARGGFFEVLRFAHKLALKENLIKNDDAGDFSAPQFKDLFSKYTICVGSTGNLGLSIGIISAKLGFRVKVYMSHDAKEWKKELLRRHGAQVIEEPGDFSVAISKGRNETLSNPYGYFVDDENSSQLFQGYSLAAFELKEQLEQMNIFIDEQHPLFVYSPCGVGGSPGGVLFGLKMLYGNAVHSFFAEPTHSPSVMIGLITGKKEKVSVQDFNLDNRTEADGLAVGRPSAFASGIIKKLVSGIYTVEDQTLFILLKELYESEGIFIEPSATAGLIGPEKVLTSLYAPLKHINPANITHVSWATGGGLIPENLRGDFLK